MKPSSKQAPSELSSASLVADTADERKRTPAVPATVAVRRRRARRPRASRSAIREGGSGDTRGERRELTGSRPVLVVRVGEEENGLLERLHLGLHLVHLDVRLELGEVVDGALAVGGSDDEGRVLPDVLCHLAPCSLDGSDGVGQSAVLGQRLVNVRRRHHLRQTEHVEEDCISSERRLDVLNAGDAQHSGCLNKYVETRLVCGSRGRCGCRSQEREPEAANLLFHFVDMPLW